MKVVADVADVADVAEVTEVADVAELTVWTTEDVLSTAEEVVLMPDELLTVLGVSAG